MSMIKWTGALLLASSLLGPAQAQDEVTIVRTLTVSVAAGKNAQFEEFVRAFRDASREQGLANYWLSAQSVSGEPIYKFNTTLPSYAEITNPGPQLAAAYGEQEAARLLGLLGESVLSTHTAFYERHSSMSRPPVGFDGPPEGLIYFEFDLNPGGAPLFLEMSSKVKEATDALVPDNYYVSDLPGFGASGARTIVLLRTFGDLDGQQMGPAQRVIRHFGEEEGGRINALAQQAISGLSAELFRTRPDLNYQPAE